MAHAAKIDENGIVREVLVVDNDKLLMVESSLLKVRSR